MPRVVGKQGALFLFLTGAWNFVADLYDWEINYEMVTLDASIKMDTAQRNIVSHGRGRLTAKRYVQQGGTFVFGDLITAGARIDWAVTAVDTVPPTPSGFTGNATGKAQGTGYIDRAIVGAPRGMVIDNVEFELDTLPVFT